MDMLLANPARSIFESLGFLDGDSYHINDNCLATLEEIHHKLTDEDRSLRTFRRAVGFVQNIKKDLVPILIYVKDNPKIVDLTIKILVNLTVPVECLLSVDDMSRNNVGQHTIYELNSLLMASKEAFIDSRATKAVINYMKQILQQEGKMTNSSLDTTNNCLLLLRNILHIPEPLPRAPHTHTSAQNQIIWNLFTFRIDKVILFLITHPQNFYWSVTMVQFIALIFKDQHVGNLQKLLNIWIETSISDSSEDNESNTSAPEKKKHESSPTVSSDPTSSSESPDSSDTSDKEKSKDSPRIHSATKERPPYKIDIQKLFNKPLSTPISAVQQEKKQQDIKTESDKVTKVKIETNISTILNVSAIKIETMSDISDCGYVTQMESQESISTSSNEDDAPHKKPVHQKHHNQKQRTNAKVRPAVNTLDKKDKRKKKLVKRGKTNIINMKGLLNRTATDDDITNVLKEFTVDFLLKGYDALVQSIHKKLLFDANLQIDTSHFFWLVTYFLKFAAQLDLDIEYVNRVLSYELISYLTYEGVKLCEQIQLASKVPNSDMKPILRRMHLVVTAIREFVQTVESYKKIPHLTEEQRSILAKLQIRICSIADLRCLLVLLLRHYQPDTHAKQYLQDLIVTNHALLIFLDNAAKLPENPGVNMLEHVKQFATIEVMHQYGLLLADFKNNGEYVNDCIFTMMHHIGGDLNCITTLFQPNILRVFSLIWETDFEVCDDWSDLIDYVINTFVKTPRPFIPNLKDMLEPMNPCEKSSLENSVDMVEDSSWTQEEINSLSWHYIQSKNSPNVIGKICSLFAEEGIVKDPQSVVKQLTSMKLLSPERRSEMPESQAVVATMMEAPRRERDEIDTLKDNLIKQNLRSALNWLQSVLLEVCYAKVCFYEKNEEEKTEIHSSLLHPIEPIVYHYLLTNQSIPIVPWNNEQSSAVHNQTFLLLLQRFGFQLPIDTGKLFVRIPNYWTTDILFHIACRLGPINISKLKFTIQELRVHSASENMEIGTEADLTKLASEQLIHDENSFQNYRTNHMEHFTSLTSSNRRECGAVFEEEKNSSWINLITNKKGSLLRCGKNKSSEDIPMDITPRDEDIKEEHRLMGPPRYPLTPATFSESASMLAHAYEENSMCETASVTSDLTRMYVSDEEDR